MPRLNRVVTQLTNLRAHLETDLPYPNHPVPVALILLDVCRALHLDTLQTAQVLGAAGLHFCQHYEDTPVFLRSANATARNPTGDHFARLRILQSQLR